MANCSKCGKETAEKRKDFIQAKLMEIIMK
jgi:hypothetical protein